MISVYQHFLSFVLLFALSTSLPAENKKDYIPKLDEFPPPNTGTYIAGELVMVDPINRRGGLRLDGGGCGGLYHVGPIHQFVMLPYGMIWYHGAPAELRDIPIGTHLHGYLYLPSVGEEETIPPPRPYGSATSELRYVPKYNYAISLEDDFSFYQRRGQMWEIVSIDIPRWTIDEALGVVTPGDATQRGKLHVVSTGQAAKDGISGKYTFEIDQSTRVWKRRKPVELQDIAPKQIVQLDLTWTPGWRDREYCISDIWINEESREISNELQRRRHIRYQRYHWLAGWVDQVEHEDFGGGIVTITLFGGMDPSLYEEFKAKKEKDFDIAVAEKTLRTWWHNNDKKSGQVIEWKEIENPPPGSSGHQLRLKFTELLKGYRPGRIIRVRCDGWPNQRLSAEE